MSLSCDDNKAPQIPVLSARPTIATAQTSPYFVRNTVHKADRRTCHAATTTHRAPSPTNFAHGPDAKTFLRDKSRTNPTTATHPGSIEAPPSRENFPRYGARHWEKWDRDRTGARGKPAETWKLETCRRRTGRVDSASWHGYCMFSKGLFRWISRLDSFIVGWK